MAHDRMAISGTLHLQFPGSSDKMKGHARGSRTALAPHRNRCPDAFRRTASQEKDMRIDSLRPGQPIRLTTSSASLRNTYDSHILAVSETRLDIATPSLKGLSVPLPAGEKLQLQVQTPDGACRFDTEVVGRDPARGSLCLRSPSVITAVTDGPADGSRCKFTAVTSGKGGVGKTSFTINYAVALAEQGLRVLLFDADLGMANVDVLIKASSRYGIVDVMDGGRNMHEVITRTDYGFDIIAGGSGMAKLGALSPTQLQRITAGFTWLASQYDHVLIDTGAGLSRNVTAFIHAADETIVVTTPEPHAITDAYSIVKVILEEDPKLRLKLLINKCESNAEGADVMKRVSRVIRNFLDYTITPIGCMPESKAVGRSIREQVPFMASRPESDVARCLRGIAETECRSRPVAQRTGAEEKRPTETGFVGRFMRLLHMA